MAYPPTGREVLADEEGGVAVRMARQAVLAVVASRTAPGGGDGAGRLAPVFQERRGVFVTWKVHPGGLLRGCIGYPLPVLPLADAIRRAAVSAAVEDPRFPPVTAPELAGLSAEVSVLGFPSPLSPTDRARWVVPGRDGVIVETNRTSGLLLPQVAVELGWTAEELLDGTCEKAGLPPGAWRRPEVQVRTFQAEVFGEDAPGGTVHRRRAQLPGPAGSVARSR